MQRRKFVNQPKNEKEKKSSILDIKTSLFQTGNEETRLMIETSLYSCNLN